MCIMKSTVLVGSDQLWGRAILSLCICILARYEITLSLFRQPLYESHSRSPPLPTPKRQKTAHTRLPHAETSHTQKTRQTHDQKRHSHTRTHKTSRTVARYCNRYRYVHFSTARRRTNGDPARGNIKPRRGGREQRRRREEDRRKVD